MRQSEAAPGSTQYHALAERFAHAAQGFRGRHAFDVDMCVGFGQSTWLVRIREGCVTQIVAAPLMVSCDFAIVGSTQAWAQLWQPMPEPGWHDIFALAKRGELSMTGTMQPLMANLQDIKNLLDSPRLRASAPNPARAGGAVSGVTAEAHAGVDAAHDAAHDADDHQAKSFEEQHAPGTVEPMVGRYVHARVQSKPCRIYFEEAGEGTPLVCLHTAGADGRQYRHMLSDPAITSRFRVIAFDMPGHGKSYLPQGETGSDYRLTTARYVDTILAFCDALGLARPALIGCSIGGRIVLELARAHAGRFSALIGVESADHQQPWYDTRWLHRGDVHGGEVCAALVSGLVAPQSPARYREETLWQYMQGGPGIFRGDLHFYREDADYRGTLDAVRTDACPLYLLTGEYDFSCTPEDTQRTAQAIAGARVTTMREVGHFPMSENPDRFRHYILPVLDDIHTRTRRQA